MKKQYLFVVFIGFVFSVNAQASYAYDSIPNTLLINANAIVRNEKVFIQVTALDKMIIKVQKVVTIKNKHGDAYNSLYVHYNKHSKIKSIKTIIYDRYGQQIRKIKSNEYNDISAVSGGTLYADSRIRYFRYIPIGYPYTIYFEYELQTSNTGFVNNWYPIMSTNTSVEHSTYEVQNSIGTQFKTLGKLFEKFNVVTLETPTGIRCSLTSFSAIKYEELSGGIKDKVPYMLVHMESFSAYGVKGKFANWKEFGEWMNFSVLTDTSSLSEQTIKEVLALTDGVASSKERARIVYEYMQGKMRYISVQVGIGGIQPEKVMYVDNLGYGDCKGLAFYTKKILELVKVPANYVVVQAGRNIENFEPDFSSIEQGNHIILNLPFENEDVWLECTNMDMPFGFLGDFIDDRKVLVVTENGGKIKKTPAYKTENNLQITAADVLLLLDGSIKGDVKITSTGIQYNNHYYIATFDQDRLQKYYKERYWEYINNLSLNTINFKNDKEKIAFTEDLSFEIASYVQTVDDKLFLDVNVFNKFTKVPKKYRIRKYKLEKQRGWRDEEIVNIEIPNSYALVSMPSDVEISNEFGFYSLSLEKVSDIKFLYKRVFQLNKGVYPKELYKNYRKFIKKVVKYDQSKLILTRRKI